jgi:hypothetical protein
MLPVGAEHEHTRVALSDELEERVHRMRAADA